MNESKVKKNIRFLKKQKIYVRTASKWYRRWLRNGNLLGKDKNEYRGWMTKVDYR